MAKTDFFLKLDGIKGESTDAKHKGEIEIESFSLGLTNTGSFSQAPGRDVMKPIARSVQ